MQTRAIASYEHVHERAPARRERRDAHGSAQELADQRIAALRGS